MNKALKGVNAVSSWPDFRLSRLCTKPVRSWIIRRLVYSPAVGSRTLRNVGTIIIRSAWQVL